LVDYFQAAKPILALGWEKSASIMYLKNNSIGVTVSDLDNLEKEILLLLNALNSAEKIGTAAWQFGKDKHNSNLVLANFERQLVDLTA
jgi:hypothetical protein